MAETNQKVMEMVRQAIQRKPDVATDELYKRAQKVDASVADLTLRQFHARYPLQVKRKIAAASGKKRRRARPRRAPKGGEVDRGAIRKSLVAFAREVSAAGDEGSTAHLIDAMQSVDSYVDQIVKALGKT